MTVQTAGVVLLAAAAGLAGKLLSDATEADMRREDALAALLSDIGTSSALGGLPLSAVYERFSSDALDACGFTRRLRKDGLAAALKNGKTPILHDSETLEILCRFADEIGSCPNRRCVGECCEKYRTLFCLAVEKNRGKKKTRVALSRKMGLLAAVFVLIFGL